MSASFLSALFLFAEPAVATSCNEVWIAAMSTDEAAEIIWNHSDLIGFGYVSVVDTPERVQQFVDLVAPLKGTPEARIPLAPIRVGRIAEQNAGIRNLRAEPGEIVLVTLVRTEQGYVMPACRPQLLAKDTPAIIRRLYALSRQRRP